MTKVVNLGRVVVAALLFGAGLWCFTYVVSNAKELVATNFSRTPEIQPAPGEAAVMWMIDLRFVGWIPLFISAWGIYRWRQWGQVLTAFLSGMIVLATAMFVVTFGLKWQKVVQGVVALGVFAWLMLPAVRAEYWREDKMVTQSHE